MANQNITEHQAEMIAKAVEIYLRIEDMEPLDFISMLASLAEQACEEKFEPHNLQSR